MQDLHLKARRSQSPTLAQQRPALLGAGLLAAQPSVTGPEHSLGLRPDGEVVSLVKEQREPTVLFVALLLSC